MKWHKWMVNFTLWLGAVVSFIIHRIYYNKRMHLFYDD